MKDKFIHIWSWMKQHPKGMTVFFIVKLLLKISLLGWLLFSWNKSAAQSTNKLLREGNKFYQQEKYNNATESYSKALQKAPKDVRANFNQGDALFKLNQLDKAKDQYLAAAKLTNNTEIQAKAFYNIGNAWYKQQKWEESAKSYKVSLKLNPKDMEAKYNLMMALSKIKKNGGGGGKNNQKKDQKDQKDQKQNQQQQQQNGNQQQQQQQNGQQKQQQQERQVQMTSDEAKKLLDAISGEETKVQEKVNKDKKGQAVKTQRDW